MEEEKKQERSFELRSEKVRSIVGQIPSSLVRYGITAIGAVLLCLLAVAYFLPYEQVYSGTATVHGATTATPADSTDITILLKFENKRPDNVNGQMIYLQSPYRTFAGQIRDLSPVRDTLERQKAICRFKVTEIKSVENQTVDFQIVSSSGNLLQKMLGDI
ncbi:hypothetical protein HMPREF0666_01976 [Prevotella sp. C561]|jgi:hypothetical protein|uniref:Uncharacterized protein n=1 Tax=Segatella salivae TaxID=228604 RepID=A0AAW4NPM3_9BACT|nr:MULTISPECIES: hypothetical protein [Prevotellaceae]EGW46874.1 hypothetical protein HMPREF0666_01976 [Prevotella sp. C561]MBW4866933.1 hypothetical protein [Segatella salivae]MBW4908341.1 hypothetical protein [Segatella salivae]MBW4910972.1 hypothetical protein [Segatella salivae]